MIAMNPPYNRADPGRSISVDTLNLESSVDSVAEKNFRR